jgi:mRNA interferase RelE/StbE
VRYAILSLVTTSQNRDIIAVKTITLSHAAAKDLDGLSTEARAAVQSAVARHATTGESGVKFLSGRQGFRLGMASARVIFDGDASTVLAIHIGKRQATTYRRN